MVVFVPLFILFFFFSFSSFLVYFPFPFFLFLCLFSFVSVFFCFFSLFFFLFVFLFCFLFLFFFCFLLFFYFFFLFFFLPQLLLLRHFFLCFLRFLFFLFLFFFSFSSSFFTATAKCFSTIDLSSTFLFSVLPTRKTPCEAPRKSNSTPRVEKTGLNPKSFSGSYDRTQTKVLKKPHGHVSASCIFKTSRRRVPPLRQRTGLKGGLKGVLKSGFKGS